MADGAALLRMLEPTVRPVQTPGGSGPQAAPQAPLEQRPFDALLAEAQQSAPSAGAGPAQQVGESQGAGEAAPPPSPLHALERVENASLRQLMAQQARAPDASELE